MRYPDTATVAQLDTFDEVIDVRSPAEYAHDHIPGAINAPVLDDEQRAQVGILYKQVSPFAARRLGAALVARNIGMHIEQLFQHRDRSWRPLIYCWRGGQRSGSMTHVMRQIGWPAAQLAGGYKSFRREVVVQLDAIAPRHRYVVLCGETGSGKSRLLDALTALGEQVLDLEALACHRGSVLGGLPQRPQPSQKGFETQLWAHLRQLDPQRPVYIEAESKKIGTLRVPDALIEAIRAAECVQLHAPMTERVRFLCEEYAFFLADPARLVEQLDCLRPLYGKEVIGRWNAQIAAREWDALVTDLLDMHYDPLYRRSTNQNFARLLDAMHVCIDALTVEGLARAASEIAARVNERATAARQSA